MLDRETARRRLIAARVLAGLSREELTELMVERGWGREDVNRLEREVGKKGGDPGQEPPRLDQRATDLAQFTGLPPAWFIEPDATKLFAGSSSELHAELEDLRERTEQVVTRQSQGAKTLGQLERALGDLQQRLAQAERRLEANGRS